MVVGIVVHSSEQGRSEKDSVGSNPVYNAKIFTKNIVEIEISNFLTIFIM